MATTKKPKSIAAPSKGRAAKGAKEGMVKTKQIADRYMQQYYSKGSGEGSGSGAVSTPSYAMASYGGKRTPGANTPRARAADAAVGRDKPLAKKGK
jgi:hypothetical protein